MEFSVALSNQTGAFQTRTPALTHGLGGFVNIPVYTFVTKQSVPNLTNQ